MPFSRDEVISIAKEFAKHIGVDVSGLSDEEIVKLAGFFLPPKSPQVDA